MVGYFLDQYNDVCLGPADLTEQGVLTLWSNCASGSFQLMLGGPSKVSCWVCLPGYALSSDGCLPCVLGCSICNALVISQCM